MVQRSGSSLVFTRSWGVQGGQLGLKRGSGSLQTSCAGGIWRSSPQSHFLKNWEKRFCSLCLVLTHPKKTVCQTEITEVRPSTPSGYSRYCRQKSYAAAKKPLQHDAEVTLDSSGWMR